jgi:hypothetical protein
VAAPTYFGSAAVPADGAAAVNATSTITITPPASMLPGDLVVVVGVSGASATWSNGVTGGQTWTAQTAHNGTAGPYCRLFWCVFNGTWAASPRFDSTSATNTSAFMHVFRPDSIGKTWALDVDQATTTYTAPTTPFTVTRTGLTNVHADTVTLACFHSIDDNTWGSMTGTGWVLTGSAQYRNTSGTPDNSSSFAHHLDAPAGSVVPNVSKNQATLGGDAGVTTIIAFCAFDFTTDLVAYWKLDEASGTRNDSVGTSHLTDVNTVTSATGKIGNAASFDRTSAEALTVADNAALSMGDLDFSISLWVNFPTAPGGAYYPGIIGKWATTHEYILAYDGDTNNLYWSVSSDGTAETNLETGPLSANTWYHVVAFHDSINNQIGLVINAGTPDTTAWSGGVFNGTSNLTLGDWIGYYWLGLIDEVGIWKRLLTSTERTQLYNSGAGLAYPFAIGLSFRTSSFIAGTGSDPVTFTSVATGTASADRINVVALCYYPRPVPTGVTINGVTATKAVDNASGSAGASIWYAANPSGTTGNVVITFGDATTATIGLGMWSLTGAGAAPTDTDSNASTPVNSMSLSALTIPVGGGAIIAGFNGTAATGFTWSNAAENYDTNATNLRITGASTPIAGTPTITMDGADGDTYVMVGAAWGMTTGGGALTKSLSDGLSLGETRTGAAGFNRSMPDALTVVEAILKAMGFVRSQTDPLTLTEAIAKALSMPRTLSDPLTLGETLAKTLLITKAVADGLTLGEVLAKVMAFGRSSTDALTLAENLAKAMAFARTLSDPLIIGETLAKVAAFRRSLGDSLSISENLLKQLGQSRAFSDALSLAEVISSQMVLLRTASDALGLGETILAQLAIGVIRTEPISLADVVAYLLISGGPEIPGGTGGYTSRGYVVFDQALPELAPKEKPWPSPEEQAIIGAIVNFVTGRK